MIKTKILTINGSQVVIYPVKGMKAARIEVMVKAGSWYEKSEKWGKFHLIEHLIFEGNSQFSSRQVMEDFKLKHGINGNGSTGGNTMVFWWRMPVDEIEAGLELAKSMLLTTMIDRVKADREIEVISHEYNDKWNLPGNRFDRAWRQQLFGLSHPMRRDGMGDPNYLKTVELAEIQKLYREYIQPSRMSLVIVGDVEVAKIEKWLERYWQGTGLTANDELDLPDFQSGEQRLTMKEKVEQAEVKVSFLLPGKDKLTESDRFGLNLASFMLGGGPQSRLFEQLRQRKNLVYKTGSYYWIWSNVGCLELLASTEPGKINEVLTEMKEVLTNFLEQKWEKDYLTTIQHYLDGQTLMAYDSIGAIAADLVQQLFFDQRILTPEEKNEIAHTLTEQKIKDLLLPYLDWPKRFESVMTK